MRILGSKARGRSLRDPAKDATHRRAFGGGSRGTASAWPCLLTALVMLLAGCAGAPPAPPPVLTVNIVGSVGQNPNAAGQGQTVAVRLYQLSSAGRFQAADVYTLMGSEAAALETDEAAPSAQFLLAPGQSLTETVPLKPLVSSVGFAVLFQNINQSAWKLVAPVAANGPSVVTLRVIGLKATIAAPAASGP